MVLFSVSSVLFLLSLPEGSHAFTVFTAKPLELHVSRPTALFSTKSRVAQVGAGIPLVPSGNNLLFDPDKEGKVGNTAARVKAGVSYTFGGWGVDPSVASVPVATSTAPTKLFEAQHWLEDIGIPSNFAKPTAPVEATVLGRAKLIGDDAPGDIQHVILKLPPGMHYVEGQSLSVIPPGLAENGKPHKPRLYSIASTRYGDLLTGDTVSLCVRRAEYWDPVTGQNDPTKAGVCSSFLCDAQPGDVVSVAGPVGKTMLLPEDPNTDIIMVATGTGVAPFRAFLHRLFMEQTVARHAFTGEAWLILGVPVTSGLLYPQEFEAMQEQLEENEKSSAAKLTIDYAISREMTNAQGGKLYVQDVLAEQSDRLLEKLENGAVIYFCGLKGMMPGILESLEKVCASRGMNFAEKMKEYKDRHQWHVEVY
ncbi:oxidoreductase [Fragilaria crotonensis]|nr:oxidoreductase [Fragilaria crotonensis]